MRVALQPADAAAGLALGVVGLGRVGEVAAGPARGGRISVDVVVMREGSKRLERGSPSPDAAAPCSQRSASASTMTMKKVLRRKGRTYSPP